MASVNKVIIVGNLGRDPETRFMPNGECVCTINVATTESWKDKNSGEKKEVTEWHRIVFYRKLGEIVDQYCRKGTSIYVEGRLQTRKWTDKENVERYTTQIIGDSMQMLGGTQQGSAPTEKPAHHGSHSGARPAASKPAPRPSRGFPDDEDDIPF